MTTQPVRITLQQLYAWCLEYRTSLIELQYPGNEIEGIARLLARMIQRELRYDDYLALPGQDSWDKAHHIVLYFKGQYPIHPFDNL